MHKALFTSLMVLGLLFSFESCKKLPFPPIPSPTPTPNRTPTCGFTDLGSVLCGGTSNGFTVIRSLSDWNAFAGATTCSGATAPPLTNFNQEMILIYTAGQGGFDPRTSAGFTRACLFSDHMEVAVQVNEQDAIMAPFQFGACLCQNKAVTVPATKLPIQVTVCHDAYYLNTLNSSSCNTTTY